MTSPEPPGTREKLDPYMGAPESTRIWGAVRGKSVGSSSLRSARLTNPNLGNEFFHFLIYALSSPGSNAV